MIWTFANPPGLAMNFRKWLARLGALCCAMLAALGVSAGEPAAGAAEFCHAPDSSFSDRSIEPVPRPPASLAQRPGQRLRVLLQYPAHACAISKKERRLIEGYAAANGLWIDWRYVAGAGQLLPALAAGLGDIVLGQDQALAAESDAQAQFTYAWADSAWRIIQRRDNGAITRPEHLAGRQIAAYRDARIWPLLTALAESVAGLDLLEVPRNVPYRELLERVKTGQYDLTVADGLLLEDYLAASPELEAAYRLTAKRNMAWAVPATADELLDELNQYLHRQHFTHAIATTHFDDFPAIKARGILRVITSANPAHYYLQNGRLLGFEYELLRDFAASHKLRLDMVIARSRAEMFALLTEGKGDVIAASLPGGALNAAADILFTRPYHYASPVLVGRGAAAPMHDFSALAGRRITLSPDNPYWHYLRSLQQAGLEFELAEADEGVDLEASLAMVALGVYDLTVVGSHQFNMRFAQKMDLGAGLRLAGPLAHRWALRAANRQLAAALNDYIERRYRQRHYNVLHAKYFELPPLPKAKKPATSRIASLSPYDDLTRLYADKYAFDWRLIIALMFQESRFDPNAYSSAGARGLMQLIPTTARQMGVNDSQDPADNIYGGVRYLSYLRDKFEDTLLLEDRIWFTLAAYNAGYGRVKKARALAGEMGLDQNRWFANVELAMLRLARPYMQNGKRKRYCRCGQAVVYVREIRTRYFNYIRLLENQRIAAYPAVKSGLETLN